MGLSADLISQFVKITNDKTEPEKASVVTGTIVYDGRYYVRLDGSDLLTPVSTTADVNDGDRVQVTIDKHTATVTGNITSPSARTDDVRDIGSKIDEFEIVVANRVTTEQLNAEQARIDALIAEDALIKGQLTANNATIDELKAKDVEIEGSLTAQNATIENLKSTTLTVDVAKATYAEIKDLEATNAKVNNLEATYGEFQELTTKNFEATNASITNLEAKDVEITGILTAQEAEIVSLKGVSAEFDTLKADVASFKNTTTEQLTAQQASIADLSANKLSAKDADLKYANIDFSNIEMAAVEELFTKSGIIKDLVVGEQKITGELVGVTIKGDLIEAGTLKADKLVIKGSDGIFYKLNVEAGGMSAEKAPTDSLHGSVITAKSIVAEQIAVEDLVAFGATIGGFHITDNSIYSGVKESVNNTTRGLYLDNDGQFNFGDSNSFIKYYKDENGAYKLSISAESITIGTGKKSVETIASEAEAAANTVKELEERITDGTLAGEDATVLRIDSSRGTVFKNNAVSTVLSAVIYKGSKRITDITALREEYGASAYLEWQWQRMGETTFGTILSTDDRIGQDGFTFTLSPEDVDTKVVFMCQLITA